MENSRRTTARPRFATFIHFCVDSPFSTCLARARTRLRAVPSRFASVFASRVRAHGNLGLAGVCARVGRPGRWRHPSRTRYPRACPHPVARETIINKVYYASATRHRDAPTRYLFRRQDATRENHCRDAAGLFVKNRAGRSCANAMTYTTRGTEVCVNRKPFIAIISGIIVVKYSPPSYFSSVVI